MPERIIRRGQIEPEKFSLTEGPARVKDEQEDKPSIEELLRREYERGLEDGKQHAKEMVKTHLDMLKNAVEDFSKEKQEAFKQAERHMVELSLKIAEVIIAKEVSTDPKVVVSIVKEVLEGVKDKSKITLFISPQDEAVIKEHMPKFMAGIESEIELISDESVEPGGCIVQTPSGRIDALISTQIEEMKKRLL